MKYLKLIFCLTSRQLNKFSETCFYSYHYDFTGLRFQKPTITVCTQNDRAFSASTTTHHIYSFILAI